MPIRKVPGGFKWGKHGKTYRSRKGAERQAAAAYAAGYREEIEVNELIERMEALLDFLDEVKGPARMKPSSSLAKKASNQMARGSFGRSAATHGTWLARHKKHGATASSSVFRKLRKQHTKAVGRYNR